MKALLHRATCLANPNDIVLHNAATRYCTTLHEKTAAINCCNATTNLFCNGIKLPFMILITMTRAVARQIARKIALFNKAFGMKFLSQCS